MIAGMKRLKRTLRQAPARVQEEARKAVIKSTEEGVRIAQTLAPEVTGKTRSDIHAKYSADGLVGSVEAAEPTKEAQIRAKAIEFGREKGNRGTTTPRPFIEPTALYLGARHKRRVAGGIRKGVKAAAGG